MSNVKDLHGKLQERRDRLARLFDDNKTPEGGYNLTPEQRESVKSLNDELTDLGKQYDQARADHELYRANEDARKSLAQPFDFLPYSSNSPQSEHERAKENLLSLGERFIASQAYKSYCAGNVGQIKFSAEDFDVTAAIKTTMTTAAGYAPYPPRTNIAVPYAVRRPVVADLIPQDTTMATSIIYMEETTFTNNAAPVAENALKPESASAWTQRTQPCEVIATILPVTEQQLAIGDQVRSTIDNRLTLFVRLAEETQLLTGDGSTPNLQGFLTKTGVQTQAKGGDPVPSAVYKAMTLVRHTGFAEPSGVVMHPNDWQDVRLLQTTTGEYIWGSPSEAGPERIWGLPVVATVAETENTALVGDFVAFSHISRLMGIDIRAGLVGDDFKYNRITLRAEERIALEIYRAAAFCKVTGI